MTLDHKGKWFYVGQFYLEKNVFTCQTTEEEKADQLLFLKIKRA